jgi:hypothetical protein
MFVALSMNLNRLLPQLWIETLARGRTAMHQSLIDLEEMPESWQRDIGILDGRDRRGDCHGGAFRATRMICLNRNL